MFEFHRETPEDWWEVEALYDLCFAPGREALSSYRLREGVPKVKDLCLVARESGVLAGVIRYWPVMVGRHKTLLLGPVAVHPTHQGEGLGALLIQKTMQRAAAEGWSRVLLVGDEPYYSRFGFTRLSGVEMPPPTNPSRVLGHALSAGAWNGVQGLVTKAECGGELENDGACPDL